VTQHVAYFSGHPDESLMILNLQRHDNQRLNKHQKIRNYNRHIIYQQAINKPKEDTSTEYGKHP
jgi:hypothetical protein